MTHSEIAKHIREQIRKYRIEAQVHINVLCDKQCIFVNTRYANAHFSDEESIAIKKIARENNLTDINGNEISMDACNNNRFLFIYNN